MGYVLEIRAGNLDTITTELQTPNLKPHDLRDRTALDYHPELADAWPQIQNIVATTIAAGEQRTVSGPIAAYLITVIAHHSHPWAGLQHTASGGPEFRAEITTDAAPIFGLTLTAGLVRRPILGLYTDDYPFFGWADTTELHQSVAALPADSIRQSEDDTEVVRTFRTCITSAARRNLDLITIYA